MVDIELKRAYEPASATDGYRIFVDRLWPRGLSKEEFKYDLWAKEISPSTELREWFHVDTAGRWPEFSRKYSAELKAMPAFLALVQQIKPMKKVTLVYGSHDTEHNQAVVIRSTALEMLNK